MFSVLVAVFIKCITEFTGKGSVSKKNVHSMKYLALTLYQNIPWKTNTPESKISTSPSQIVIKFGVHIVPIAKHLCLISFYFCQVDF
jgi:hypothetical protein